MKTQKKENWGSDIHCKSWKEIRNTQRGRGEVKCFLLHFSISLQKKVNAKVKGLPAKKQKTQARKASLQNKGQLFSTKKNRQT